jgi:hypothetical protein
VPEIAKHLLRSWRRFREETGGGIATFAGVAIPAVALLGIGAVELASVSSDRTILQDAADAAALMGARELSLASSDGVADRTEGYALSTLTSLASRSTVTAEAAVETLDGRERVRVLVTSNRRSFFGNLLPPGGFLSRAEAIGAVDTSQPPLCVVALSTSGASELHVRDVAQLHAPGCLAHSNAGIEVDRGASLKAAVIQAALSLKGSTTPAAATGMPRMTDPLAYRDIPTASCPNNGNGNGHDDEDDDAEVTYNGNATLAPGVHCGGVVVEKTAVLTLSPGVHYFSNGDLQLRKNATLQGENVVLVFGFQSTLKSQDEAAVDLVGRQSGGLAGMVLVSTRNNTRKMELQSSNVRRIEGVVYMPAAELLMANKSDFAAESDWTVTVTKTLRVRGGARLVVKNGYSASPVPVPKGVGQTAAGVRLIR